MVLVCLGIGMPAAFAASRVNNRPLNEAKIIHVLDEESTQLTTYLTCGSLDTTMFNFIKNWWSDEMLRIGKQLAGTKKTLSPALIKKIAEVSDLKNAFNPDLTLAQAMKICAYPDGKVEQSPTYRFIVLDFPQPAQRVDDIVYDSLYK